MHAAAQPKGWFARLLHPLFEASLVLKGVFAVFEAAAGLGLLWFPGDAVQRFTDWLTRVQIAHHPEEHMTVAAQRLASGMSVPSEHFYAYYLLSHGVLKLTMVTLLARRVRWGYPAALAVLAAFIAYQIAHGLQTGSTMLFVLSAFDTLMFVLIVREWRLLPVAGPLAVARAGEDGSKT
jgi:uncharacterized membrane protein